MVFPLSIHLKHLLLFAFITYTHTHTLSLSLSPLLFSSLSLSPSLSLSYTHTHIHTISLSHTLSLSISFHYFKLFYLYSLDKPVGYRSRSHDDRVVCKSKGYMHKLESSRLIQRQSEASNISLWYKHTNTRIDAPSYSSRFGRANKRGPIARI